MAIKINKKISFSLVSAVCLLWTQIMYSKSFDVFFIERNKNKNIVQYALNVDFDKCAPVSDEPGHAFWRNFEISPTDVESVGMFEKLAYGIKSQKVQKLKNGDYNVIMFLEALPKRRIDIKIGKDENNKCSVVPFTTISDNTVIFTSVYVFAKERFALPPKVVYILLKGKSLDGKQASEKVLPD